MKVNDTVFIIVNNAHAVPVKIISISGNLYTVKFLDVDRAIRVTKHRLYETQEEAELKIPAKEDTKLSKGYRKPDLH